MSLITRGICSRTFKKVYPIYPIVDSFIIIPQLSSSLPTPTSLISHKSSEIVIYKTLNDKINIIEKIKEEELKYLTEKSIELATRL